MSAVRKQRASWDYDTTLETGEPDPVEEYPSQRRVIRGSLWMLGLTVGLFFLPVANGMIGGVVGGYRVGHARNALMSALGPLLFATCFLWMLLTLLPITVMGTSVNQAGVALLIAMSDLGLLVGAGIGGTVAQNRIDRLNRA